MITKYLVALFTSFVLFAVLARGNAFAQTQTCQPIYGGGQSCVQSGAVSVDTQIKNPFTNDYVDNLGITDPKYLPEQAVPFKITVKNNTTKTVATVEIKYIFPHYLDFSSGVRKEYNPDTHIYSFTIDKLTPNETKTFFIVGKVFGVEELPPTQPVTCVISQTIATADNTTSQDNGAMCIAKNATVAGLMSPTPIAPTNPPTTKGGLPVYPPAQTKTTPPTGPESWTVFGLIPTGVLGFWLRRKKLK